MNQEAAIAILLLSFVIMVMIKTPITFAMIISSALAMIYSQIPAMTLVQQMCKQLNSFTLLAIPFFILMGELMAAGGISSRLLKFANVCVGQITGGLAHVNVLASMLFGGISGSAIADVSSLGVLEIPMMEEAGYDKDFSIAVTVASSCQGLIIPPSHNMVLYSMVAGGVSVGSLFCAGYIPGIMLGVAIMICCYIISKKRKYPKGEKVPFTEAIAVTKDTFFAMLAMVIIIGGVSAGFFTATEAAAVACIYCSLVGFFIYKELTIAKIPVILGNTVKTLAMVYGLIAAAGAFGWIMTYLNVPSLATNALLGISDNKYVVLLLINIILLVLGCFMDLAPLVLIMAPILLPVVQSFGMSPIQFGVVMMLNLGIGLCTPPVGTALFTGCAIGHMKIEDVSRAILPLYVPMLITLLLITYIPALTMALPNILMK
ncbi:MAG: TRAP transporter large permease [Lachnospiraceae bacterium]|nr:TRAP transporter large permease [Lachnospiraceae bacterium]